MTFSEMRAKVRTKLNAATSVFFTDDDIDTAINDGYAEMADATEFYERQTTIPMIEGHTYYDLSLNLWETFLSPRRAQNVTTSKWLEPTNPLELDLHTFPQWEQTTGEPEKHWLRGNWWYGVFPKPSRDSLGIRFYFTAIPQSMSDDEDEPQFPREFHEGLIWFAVSDLFAQKRETKKALSYWKRYQDFETALQAYVDGRTNLAATRVM